MNWDDTEFAKTRRTLISLSIILLLLCLGRIEIQGAPVLFFQDKLRLNFSHDLIKFSIFLAIVFLSYKFYFQSNIHKETFLDPTRVEKVNGYFDSIKASLAFITSEFGVFGSKFDENLLSSQSVKDNYGAFLTKLSNVSKVGSYPTIDQFRTTFIALLESIDHLNEEYQFEVPNENIELIDKSSKRFLIQFIVGSIREKMNDELKNYDGYLLIRPPVPLNFIDFDTKKLHENVLESVEIVKQNSIYLNDFVTNVNSNLEGVKSVQGRIVNEIQKYKKPVYNFDVNLTWAVVVLSILTFLGTQALEFKDYRDKSAAVTYPTAPLPLSPSAPN